MTILFKGSAEFRGAVHHRAVQFYLEIVRTKAGSIRLCAIYTIGGAQNVGILVFTGEHIVLLQRKLQCHAAQRNVISLSLLIIAKGTVGIAAAGQMGIKPLKIVLFLQLSHSGIVFRLVIRQGAGIVAVQEAVLQLVAQDLLAGCVLHHVVQLQNGIVAVVVLTNAEQEVEIIGGILLHVQRQRPGILGEILAIRCGADAIHIVAGLALHQDADHSRTGKSSILLGIAEAPQIAPGLAAISGTAIVETLGGNKRPILFVIPEHLARVQLGDAVRRSCQHSGLRRRGYTLLQGRNRSRIAGRKRCSKCIARCLRIRCHGVGIIDDGRFCVRRHGVCIIRGKGADRQQRDCHHQRQQE